MRSPLKLPHGVEITITSKVFGNRASYLGRPYLAFRKICPVMELLQMVIQMAHYPTHVGIHELQIHLGILYTLIYCLSWQKYNME